MAKKPTRLAHEIAIQLHLMTGNCTICSSRARRTVRKLLDKPSYTGDEVVLSELGIRLLQGVC